MKKLLAVVLLAVAGTATATTNLGLPAPTPNCFYYRLPSGEIIVESTNPQVYDEGDIKGRVYSPAKKEMVDVIAPEAIKSHTFVGVPTEEDLKKVKELCK